MLEHPYEVLACSWPRPVSESERRWVSEPDWDAPLVHLHPQPYWSTFDDHRCWSIDWRELFRGDPLFGGEMRKFHVCFDIRINHSGRLIFWEDDGSVIRRGDEVIHNDREAHGPQSGEIQVEAGDRLRIAQWQLDGGWTWAARFAETRDSREDDYRSAVCRRLADPEGPPLKFYCQGREPLRTILAIYSLVLNGYAPAGVLVYGEHQWSRETRARFTRALPFAQIVPTGDVLSNIRRWGGPALAEMASRCWFVMKSCISLLCGPSEFCLLDDDIVVLGPMNDGLAAFRNSEFVFAPDLEHEELYLSTWGSVFGLSGLPDTKTVNTGFYWMRNSFDPQHLARLMLSGCGHLSATWAWEQGLFAHLFQGRSITQLPSQRYFYPLIDGLPGGIDGYDYASNPCGFATVHFGGPIVKPDDSRLAPLLPQILGNRSR